VRIDRESVNAYAATLPAAAQVPPLDPHAHALEGDREQRAAFIICLDAINFGSGWWPTIRKRPGRSGYFTIATALAEHFREAGPPSPRELTEVSAPMLAAIFEQDPAHPLMGQFASSLRDVGEHVLADHGGRFAAVIDAADGSAVELASLLAGWEAFADVSRYDEREVPFFKRAQIAAADTHLAGLAHLPDRDHLTAFADNLVPHVLRVDGVLVLEETLRERIEAGELLEHGAPPEVELRACAVHAIELLSDEVGRRLAPADIDYMLWNRGRSERYKSLPRPRSRTTAY